MALGVSRFGRLVHSGLPEGFAVAAEGSDSSDAELQHKKWLKLTVEDALEPDLPICDPHHHLNPNYLPKDFLADMGGGHNIVKTVFIESVVNKKTGPIKMTPLEETEFIVRECSDLKGRTEVAAGIVGAADFSKGSEILPLLEAHLEAGRGRFRGIRLAQGNRTSDPKVREAYAHFKRLNLSLDVYLPIDSLGDVADLARTFPDIPIIVNHFGNPVDIGAGGEKSETILQAWKPEIKTLSAHDNIFLKLGGIGMTHLGFGWNELPSPPGSITMSEAAAPLVEYCIEQFGAGRCMFESNFPVDKESFSYTALWNAFKRMTKDYSESERSDLFYSTAVKVYRL